MQIVKKQHRKIEVNLIAVTRLLWQKKWWILLAGVASAVLFYLASLLFITPLYSASVTLYANNSISTDKNTSITTSDMNASARLVDTYAAIIMSDPVLDQVKEENNIRMSTAKLIRHISITQVYDTEVFKITVKNPSAKTAADIANSIAEIAPGKIAEIVDGCSIKIISNAKVPGIKSYPDDEKTIAMGLFIGLVLAVLVICTIAVLDTRVKGESDLYEWEYPVIGTIPSFAGAERKETGGTANKEKSSNEFDR